MIYINIGSNQGDRLALIERAVALIKDRWPDAGAKVSEPYHSDPWGFESAHPFINVGVALYGDSPLRGGPLALLRALQAIAVSYTHLTLPTT